MNEAPLYDDNYNFSSNNNSCSQCLKSLQLSRAYRCSQCQKAYYCNRECQRKHWNRGHKAHCRAISALKELNGLMKDMNEQTTQKSFHTAMDMVANIQNMKTPESVDDPWVCKLRKNNPILHKEKSSNSSMISISPPTQDTKVSTRMIDLDSYLYAMKSHRRRCHQRRLVLGTMESELKPLSTDIYVEHLLRLFTYNIRICIPQSFNSTNLASLSKDDISVVLNEYPDSKTLVTIQQNLTKEVCYKQDRFNTMITFLLPTRLNYSKLLDKAVTSSINIKGSYSSSQLEISFRLPYNDLKSPQTFTENFQFKPVITESNETSKTKLKAYNRLECRNCGLGIVGYRSSPEFQPTLQKVLPLPAGHWDEILDYISCFDAVSTIIFNSFIAALFRECMFLKKNLISRTLPRSEYHRLCSIFSAC